LPLSASKTYQGAPFAAGDQPTAVRAQCQILQGGIGAAVDPVRLAAVQIHKAGQQVAGVATSGGYGVVQFNCLAKYLPGNGIILALGQQGGMGKVGFKQLLGALLLGLSARCCCTQAQAARSRVKARARTETPAVIQARRSFWR